MKAKPVVRRIKRRPIIARWIATLPVPDPSRKGDVLAFACGYGLTRRAAIRHAEHAALGQRDLRSSAASAPRTP